jgi:hypothetical protein
METARVGRFPRHRSGQAGRRPLSSRNPVRDANNAGWRLSYRCAYSPARGAVKRPDSRQHMRASNYIRKTTQSAGARCDRSQFSRGCCRRPNFRARSTIHATTRCKSGLASRVCKPWGAGFCNRLALLTSLFGTPSGRLEIANEACQIVQRGLPAGDFALRWHGRKEPAGRWRYENRSA